METKKETSIDYFVAIPAFLSMLVMLNYYFSFFCNISNFEKL